MGVELLMATYEPTKHRGTILKYFSVLGLKEGQNPFVDGKPIQITLRRRKPRGRGKPKMLIHFRCPELFENFSILLQESDFTEEVL